MIRTALAAMLMLCTLSCSAEPNTVSSRVLPPLPAPISNNAVVSVEADGREFLASFAGLGRGRTHADTLAVTYVYDSGEEVWRTAGPVPGDVGRLASVAAAAGDRMFVFGGYSVAEDGSEASTPWAHAFDPASRTFEERSPMPVPVDDAVAVTWQDRYIYLISGWHDLGNVNLVQRYDTLEDTWDQATPTPGRGVFGHAGGIVGNTIVYCDGVAIEPHPDRRRDFVANDECFAGLIDPDDPRRIDWRTVRPHPGAPRYRMAAAGVDSLNAVVFVGGSENPYNYDGIGYNGDPSTPVSDILYYEPGNGTWGSWKTDAVPSMDHRGLVRLGREWLTVGGMLGEQQVTDRVVAYDFE